MDVLHDSRVRCHWTPVRIRSHALALAAPGLRGRATYGSLECTRPLGPKRPLNIAISVAYNAYSFTRQSREKGALTCFSVLCFRRAHWHGVTDHGPSSTRQSPETLGGVRAGRPLPPLHSFVLPSPHTIYLSALMQFHTTLRSLPGVQTRSRWSGSRALGCVPMRPEELAP